MADFSRMVRALRRDLNLTQGEFVERLRTVDPLGVGVSQTAVSRWENGSEPRHDHVVMLQKLADREGIKLNFSELDEFAIDDVPVVGTIMAGAFREAVNDGGGMRTVNIGPDTRYAGLPRFALQVKGPSMNVHYPENSFVICVSFAELGRDARNGERVIVYRTNFDGDIEATCKELVLDASGKPWLWPRSTDPHFQTPWPLNNGHAEDVESVSIHALVIGSYRPE